jgi:hypothetical protein
MGRLLTVLGFDERQQSMLSKEIMDAEELVIVMQMAYEQSPESYKKDILASVIAENTRLLMQAARKLVTDLPQQEPEVQPELPTEQEAPTEQEVPTEQEPPTESEPPTQTRPSRAPKKPKAPKAPKKPKAPKTPTNVPPPDDEDTLRRIEELENEKAEIEDALFAFDESDPEYTELNNELERINSELNRLQ